VNRILTLALVTLVLAGCAWTPSQPSNVMPPWKDGGSVEIITAAPDAGGPLSFRNCPTLAEARVAVPVLVAGPDANGVPFKTMVLQCIYTLDGTGVAGGPASVDILVFDASADGRGLQMWDTVRSDPGFPNPTDIPGLADVAFATGTSGHNDLWVVQGGFGFHMYHNRRAEVPLDQLVALARAMLTGLTRAPR
jgi:hypothetical protein